MTIDRTTDDTPLTFSYSFKEGAVITTFTLSLIFYLVAITSSNMLLYLLTSASGE